MHNKSIEEVYKLVKTNEGGLTTNETLKRLKENGKNSLPKKKGDSVFKIFIRELINPIVLILVVTCIFSILIKEVTDAFAIGLIIIIDLLLGTIQEWKAEKQADSLSSIIKVKVKVLRDNKEVIINSEDLVIGDIILLESGDKISADARIIEAHNLMVSESVLTGESLDINKNTEIMPENITLSEMKNMLFAGTTVTSGRVKAVVIKTGINTEVGNIAGKVATTKKEKSPLTIRMNKFSGQISFLIIIIAVILIILLKTKGVPGSEIFLSVIALSVSAMPEGLPLALTMALTITSNKMMKKKCLVKKLNSVESLGSCTYIASDKTGTLTVNEQTAKKIILANGKEFEVTGTGYNFDGKILTNNEKDIELVKEIALLGYINNEASLKKTNNGYEHFGDSIEIAFKALGNKAQVNKQDIKIEGLIPYESENKYSAVFYQDKENFFASIKGSLEVVLDFCKDVDKDEILKKNELLASNGYRVIAIASGKLKNFKKKNEYTKEDIGKLKFKGLVGFIDPVRKDAKKSVLEAKKAGIKVIMITGDHPLTAFSIAKELNICTSNKEVTTGLEIEEKLKEGKEEFTKFILTKKVFSRVTPIEKLEIVEALKRNNEFVAVTGDGVNDAPALKSASIGIAMGSGTDVAKETADMIILNDSFSTIVNGIKEGRNAYSNIRKISLMLLSCGLAEVLFFTLSIIFNLPMPLLAIQLLWLNIVTDGLQDFALSFEQAEDNIMNEPPRKTTDSIFNKELIIEVLISGLTIGIFVFIVWHYLLKSGMEVTIARGYIMALMVFMQNFHVLNCRSEKTSTFRISLKSNLWIPFVIISSIILQIIVMESSFLSSLLKTSKIPLLDMLKLLIISLIILLVFEIYKYFKRKLKRNKVLLF